MPRPHSEIPSQRLAMSRAKTPVPEALPHRSIWWAVGLTVGGLALLAYPALLLAMLSLIIMNGSLDSAATAGDVAVGILGLIASAAMVAFPPLLGFAVRTRRRALWIPAVVTGAVSLAGFLYMLFGWIIPLA